MLASHHRFGTRAVQFAGRSGPKPPMSTPRSDSVRNVEIRFESWRRATELEERAARCAEPRSNFGATTPQTSRTTGHHQGPEDEARRYQRRSRTVCKTSVLEAPFITVANTGACAPPNWRLPMCYPAVARRWIDGRGTNDFSMMVPVEGETFVTSCRRRIRPSDRPHGEGALFEGSETGSWSNRTTNSRSVMPRHTRR